MYTFFFLASTVLVHVEMMAMMMIGYPNDSGMT